jgi:hypothetical protein
LSVERFPEVHLMVVTIDSADPRSIAALSLMLGANGWAKVRLLDGQKFYGIPSRSRPHLFHLTDTQVCTCEDHQGRGVECAHILAVRLHLSQLKGQVTLRESSPARCRRPTPGPPAAGLTELPETAGEPS